MGRMIRNSSSSNSGSKKKSSHPSSRTQKRSIIDHDHNDENEMTPQSWVDRLRLIPVVTEEVDMMMIKEVEKEEKEEEEEEGDVDVDTPFTTTTTTTTTPTTNTTKHTSLLHPTKTISILTWNVLAQAYCSRRSQVELPKEYNHVVFHKTKRKQRILQLLRQLTTSITSNTNTNTNTATTISSSSSSSTSSGMDIVCLQEVDMNEIRPIMEQLGYRSVVETPRCVRANNTTMGGRIDGCSIYIRTAADHHLNIDEYGTSIVDSVATTVLDGTNDDNSNDNTTEDRPDDDDDGDHHNHNNTVTSQNDNDMPDEVTSTISTLTSLPRPSISQTVQWKLMDSELIRLDDLATLSSFSASSSSTTVAVETTTTSSTSNDVTKTNGDNSASSSSHSHIQGIQQSLLRRNMAIMIRLQHTEYPEITMIVVNAHLFWNPSFEYVKVRDFVCTFMLYHVTCTLLRFLCVLLQFFQWSNLIILLVLLYL